MLANFVIFLSLIDAKTLQNNFYLVEDILSSNFVGHM